MSTKKEKIVEQVSKITSVVIDVWAIVKKIGPKVINFVKNIRKKDTKDA